MVRRTLTLALTVLGPLAVLLAPLAVLAPAQAAGSGCATRAELGRVERGMTTTTVDRTLGARHVATASGGAGAVVWTYGACDGEHRAQVTFLVPAEGAAHAYATHWAA